MVLCGWWWKGKRSWRRNRMANWRKLWDWRQAHFKLWSSIGSFVWERRKCQPEIIEKRWIFNWCSLFLTSRLFCGATSSPVCPAYDWLCPFSSLFLFFPFYFRHQRNWKKEPIQGRNRSVSTRVPYGIIDDSSTKIWNRWSKNEEPTNNEEIKREYNNDKN